MALFSVLGYSLYVLSWLDGDISPSYLYFYYELVLI
jgi:hypothetical protein